MAASSSSPSKPAERRSSGPNASMVAIMDSQVQELRRQLLAFKVCAAAPAPGGVPEALPAPRADQLPPHADILIFGPSGSGKSSLIRTFYMALHKVAEVPVDFAGRIIVKDTNLNEGTLKYISATVKEGDDKTSSIICHDTRGHIWMDDREQRQLGVILDGQVKDDSIVQQRNFRYARLLWEFWKSDADLFPREIIVNAGVKTKPHALVFVFDGSMDEIPNGEEETQFYREIILMARSRGYIYPQVVLSRIDRVEQKINATPGADPADAELRLRQVLDRKIEDVVVKLGVSRTSVHFTENYHSGAESRNVSVDFHALRILSQCCQHADSFLHQSLRGQRASQCALQ